MSSDKPLPKLEPFEVRAKRVIAMAFGGEHHVFRLDWSGSSSCTFIVNWNDMGTYDYSGLTKLVVACHDECVRGYLRPGGPSRLRVTLDNRERKHVLPDMCAHPTLEQHVEQIRKGGSYQPLFDQLRADDPNPGVPR